MAKTRLTVRRCVRVNTITVDGNEAAARIAYALSEVVAIYPITPATPMGELADAWASEGRRNLFGAVPTVMEMQSEAGAAGAVHGATQTGALATTFTASQGLLLMIPNMFKIAGELSPAVFHVAARSVATHALSIFGDHSDVMAARSTGFALLCSGSVQEAQDLAALAHALTLRTRVPVLHFFDGFRTSHEVSKIVALEDAALSGLIDERWIEEHRARGLDPEHPVVRGTAQNPDVFFQGREAANPFYADVPGAFAASCARFAELTGRRYAAFSYEGAPDADRVLVILGSGGEAAAEVVEHLCARGQRVGIVHVRLVRPFAVAEFVATLPRSVRRLAVLDRTKEPGAVGEPVYGEVVAALAEALPAAERPEVIGGRYGLGSKEFTPAMVEAVFRELAAASPRRHFTVGIEDDVCGTSLRVDPSFVLDRDPEVTRAVFFGLGSDGTVGANKSSIKILGERTGLFVQGYFVYDSKKAGAVTVSHLRFGPRPIRSTYLIPDGTARLVAIHHRRILEREDVLRHAAEGATLLLNVPWPAEEVPGHLPAHVLETIHAKKLRVFAIDAGRIAREAGLGRRISTIMQTCFFKLCEALPFDEAFEALRESIERNWGRRGARIVERNLAAIEAARDALVEVPLPAGTHGAPPCGAATDDDLPGFVREVTLPLLQGRGDRLPVSKMPVDGTFPVGTARYEKRRIAERIPFWRPELCIECALCTLACPHAAIRLKSFDPALAAVAPAGFRTRTVKAPDLRGKAMRIQVAPEDCTGCELCVHVCPARDKTHPARKALGMVDLDPILDEERERFRLFLELPEIDRTQLDPTTVRGSQHLQPLFEFSGACAGCGETPYLELLSRLFGERALIANATGCSSIYGGNLPTTPWSANTEGRGPAWSNSLFEDAAEFGLGFRLTLDVQRRHARELVRRITPLLGEELAAEVLDAPHGDEAAIRRQRELVAALRERLAGIDAPQARRLEAIADALLDRSVWIVGGDGWAYDIGFAGLDHVLASGHNVNALVLDTEVYSNTGGQTSKATPRAAVAKFSAGGKHAPKKDLGLIAMAHTHVYVAQVAVGANPKQAIRAFVEAESYEGPSLIVAYSPCIAHGFDLAEGFSHQKLAVDCGHWPLYRYDPRRLAEGRNPLQLDSRAPRIPFREFAATEGRFRMLARAHPEEARRLEALAQQDIDEKWSLLEQMAGLHYQKETVR